MLDQIWLDYWPDNFMIGASRLSYHKKEEPLREIWGLSRAKTKDRPNVITSQPNSHFSIWKQNKDQSKKVFTSIWLWLLPRSRSSTRLVSFFRWIFKLFGPPKSGRAPKLTGQSTLYFHLNGHAEKRRWGYSWNEYSHAHEFTNHHFPSLLVNFCLFFSWN